MKCGHCGSEVEEGYTVCKSCGANLRNQPRRMIVGIIVCLFSGAYAIDVLGRLSEPNAPQVLGASVVMFVFGVLWFRSGRKKHWFRNNA